MSTKNRSTKLAEKQAPSRATLSPHSLERLFKVWCAVTGIGEDMHDDGHAQADAITSGYGATLELLGEILGDLYSEAWNSLPENNPTRVMVPASAIRKMVQPAAAGGGR